MKTFDIDCIDPGYSLEPLVKFTKRKPTHREKAALLRSTYVHVTNVGPWPKRLGVRPQTMLDWRGLERRMHQLGTASEAVNDEFWDLARSFPRKDDDSEAIVVVSDPTTGGDLCLRVRNESYSIDSTSTILSRVMKNPGGEGVFTLCPYDKGGRELGVLYRRSNRLHRSYGFYRIVFEKAIIDRLSALPENTSPRYNYRCYRPKTYVLENDGRHYVFTMNNSGMFTMHEGDVFFNRQEIKITT